MAAKTVQEITQIMLLVSLQNYLDGNLTLFARRLVFDCQSFLRIPLF